MRVCLEKLTGKLIEMQSRGIKGTLIQNAINAGYSETNIEEKEVTQAEWQVIKDAIPKEPQPKTELELLKDTQAQIVLSLVIGGLM